MGSAPVAIWGRLKVGHSDGRKGKVRDRFGWRSRVEGTVARDEGVHVGSIEDARRRWCSRVAIVQLDVPPMPPRSRVGSMCEVSVMKTPVTERDHA